jgi:uncharacterized tellurite resistance protein B-like protein
MVLRRFLPGSAAPARAAEPKLSAGDTETVRRIAGQLDALPIDRARYLAAFAYILTRAAAADLEISDVESRAIERLVGEYGGLPEAQAVLVTQIARNQSLLYGSTEDYLVTRQFRELSSADDTITAEESDTLQEIAKELDIDRDSVNVIRNEFAPKLSAIQAMLKLQRG